MQRKGQQTSSMFCFFFSCPPEWPKRINADKRDSIYCKAMMKPERLCHCSSALCDRHHKKIEVQNFFIFFKKLHFSSFCEWIYHWHEQYSSSAGCYGWVLLNVIHIVLTFFFPHSYVTVMMDDDSPSTVLCISLFSAPSKDKYTIYWLAVRVLFGFYDHVRMLPCFSILYA